MGIIQTGSKKGVTPKQRKKAAIGTGVAILADTAIGSPGAKLAAKAVQATAKLAGGVGYYGAYVPTKTFLQTLSGNLSGKKSSETKGKGKGKGKGGGKLPVHNLNVNTSSGNVVKDVSKIKITQADLPKSMNPSGTAFKNIQKRKKSIDAKKRKIASKANLRKDVIRAKDPLYSTFTGKKVTGSDKRKIKKVMAQTRASWDKVRASNYSPEIKGKHQKSIYKKAQKDIKGLKMRGQGMKYNPGTKNYFKYPNLVAPKASGATKIVPFKLVKLGGGVPFMDAIQPMMDADMKKNPQNYKTGPLGAPYHVRSTTALMVNQHDKLRKKNIARNKKTGFKSQRFTK